MRALILSDIHANLEALNAVLTAAGEWDALWNLGDMVGYGAQSEPGAGHDPAAGDADGARQPRPRLFRAKFVARRSIRLRARRPSGRWRR